MTAYRNYYDKDGKCAEQGTKAEDIFSSLMSTNGFEVTKATLQQQFKGIDFTIKGSFSVDVKAMKRLQRQGELQDEYVWLEIQNGRGNKGWLYKDADFIAFEREEDFVVIKKCYLHELVDNVCNLEDKVLTPSECLYKSYTRIGRDDILTMVQMTDLFVFPHLKIGKVKNADSVN